MAKLNRIYQRLFGSTAPANKIGKFGSLAAGTPLTTTDPTVMQALSQWLEGWTSAVLGSNSPAIEDVNAVDFVFSYQLAYLLQTGVPEWDATTIYYIGSLVNDGSGTLFISKTDANINHALTDATNWKVVNNKTVQSKTANYTILNTDKLILADATSGAITMTLPSAVLNIGISIEVKKMDTGINAVTVDSAAGTIDGASAYVLPNQYASSVFRSNGTNWEIISSYFPKNLYISSNSGNVNTTGNTLVNINNQTVTITTRGNPVRITFVQGSTALAYFGVTGSTDSAAQGTIAMLRNGSIIGQQLFGQYEIATPAGGFVFIDVVAAGTYTYQAQFKRETAATTNVGANNVAMLVEELS